MCWSPSLQKPFEYFRTKPLEKVGKKEVVYLWSGLNKCPFPFTLPTQATSQTKFGLKSKSSKNIIWDLVDENHHMVFYGTSLNDK
jgi:hypothetical protein